MGIATTTQTATTRQLSDQNSQGTVLGFNSSDLIAFYGQTPVSQRTSSAQVTIPATSVSGATNIGTAQPTTVFGFTSAAQLNGLVTLAIEMRQVLVGLGLMKGS